MSQPFDRSCAAVALAGHVVALRCVPLETGTIVRRPRMAVQSELPSDVVGLTKTAPLSRRGFMTASAASAAGYTLAAGPVRAQVVTTDTNGLSAGEAKVTVPGGEMPVYFAKPSNAQNPPIILVAMEIFGLHEYIKDVTRRL